MLGAREDGIDDQQRVVSGRHRRNIRSKLLVGQYFHARRLYPRIAADSGFAEWIWHQKGISPVLTKWDQSTAQARNAAKLSLGLGSFSDSGDRTFGIGPWTA